MWENKLEGFAVMISYGVGIGNLWRFPYLCFQHGGFTFLVPYWICLLLCGMPMCVFETNLGQFTGLHATKLWSIWPCAKTVGWAQMLICFYFCIYGVVLGGYSLLYFWHSIPTSLSGFTLPFADESEYCQKFNSTIGGLNHKNYTTCQHGFFDEVILKNEGTFAGGLDTFNVPLVWSTLVMYGLIFLSLFNRSGSLGKVSYVTAILPYVCLLTLFGANLTQEGATLGLKKYCSLNATKLIQPEVWRDAAVQVFFSNGPAWGSLFSVGAHNQYSFNSLQLTVFASLINGVTSFFGGFVVYSSLGILALEANEQNVTLANQNFDTLFNGGSDLAFVAYPTAISKMGQAS